LISSACSSSLRLRVDPDEMGRYGGQGADAGADQEQLAAPHHDITIGELRAPARTLLTSSRRAPSRLVALFDEIIVKGPSGFRQSTRMKRITRSAIAPHRAAELYALVEDIESIPLLLDYGRTGVDKDGFLHDKPPVTAGMRGLRQSLRREREPPEKYDRHAAWSEGPFKPLPAWRFTRSRRLPVRIFLSTILQPGVGRLLEPLFDP